MPNFLGLSSYRMKIIETLSKRTLHTLLSVQTNCNIVFAALMYIKTLKFDRTVAPMATNQHLAINIH